MEKESFPDVTLADTAAMEQRALNPPTRTDGEVTKDTFVVLKPKRRSVRVSTRKVLIISFIVFLVLIIIVVVTTLVNRKLCELHRECKGELETVSSVTTDPIPSHDHLQDTLDTINSSDQEPWSSIRLPRSVLPTDYHIRVKVDLKEQMYYGSVNITIRINTTTKFVVFHRCHIDLDNRSIALTSPYFPTKNIVRQMQVPNKNFHILETDKELTAGSLYTLTIGNYYGPLVKNLRGLYLSSYEKQDGSVSYLATSQLQPIDARRVFPCFDEPDFKATFHISVTYQRGYTALSNMPAMSTRTIDSQWKETQFETTPIMSTYLVAIVVSDLKPRNFTFDSDYKKYELRMWAREDAYSQTEHALDFGIKTYKYFTEYFATPDVVPKADHVAVPDFLAGAMENWGLVIYRETSLLYDKQVSSSHDKFTVTLIVAHEIAHTWFGNMVTMEWWDDLWLNEGFASLLMYLAMDHVYPTWNVFALQVVDLLSTMVKDALTTSHPVSSHIIDPDEIPQHFDSISYRKGMAILRMITGFAGADNFRDGIRRYVQKYKFKNARMSQLWGTLTESFNNTFDVARIMESWTCQMGYPLVTIEEGDGHFILHQTRFLLDQDIKKEHETNASAEYKWNIPFTYVTQRQSLKPKTVWLNFTSATIHEPNDKWILGNYEFIGYYKVMYSSQMWSLLAKQLLQNHTVFPEANRAVLIGDAFAFARANVLDYNVALNLTRYLSKEQSSIPWESFLHSIEFLKGMISYNAAYTQLQQYLKKLVAPVFEMVGTADKGELPEKYLRGVILSLACDVGVDKAVEYAKSMFANWMKHDARLPPDLSMVIYSVGIREGDSTEWDYVWNKKLSTTVASEENIMMESLVYTQKPSLLWRYIKWLLDPSKIKPQDVHVVIGYFSKTPLSRMVAVQFVMSQWDDLIAKFSNDQFILRDIIQEVTAFVNTEFNLEQFERIFAKNTPKVASKSVENALALIRANIGWMKTNYEKITTWLEHEKY